jgi:LysR family glycine cleavage system transcriptional activator
MPLPIRDLYTFFVVARAGAMQAAARELGVTPGAISQRIRSIEKHHGKRLFVRSRDGISLTVSGKSLWKEVEGAFARIEASHRRHFCKNGQTTLRISAAPTFAHSFLVSNLASFNQVHPAIKLSIETDDRLVDLRSEPIDLAIRHGLGDYPGLRSDWLCAPELIVVGSPTLLESQPPVREPADCLRFTLLPDETGLDWTLWFEAHGIGAAAPTYGTAFKDGFLTVKAAVRGQGLALINDIYVREELSDGRLVRLLAESWPTKFAYYAVALSETFDRTAVRTFVKWLSAECAGMQEHQI